MIVSRIPIRNVTNHDLTVHIEPWGEQHVLVSEDTLDLVFYSLKLGLPEFVVDNLQISVYGWEGCSFKVLKNNLCVVQSSLIDIIKRLCLTHGIAESALELDPELLEYAQVVFDASPLWEKSGIDAGFDVVCRIAPLLSKLNDDAFLWHFCQTVLYSRGVFLREDATRQKELIVLIHNDRANAANEITRRLTAWYEATCSFEGCDSTSTNLITPPVALQ